MMRKKKSFFGGAKDGFIGGLNRVKRGLDVRKKIRAFTEIEKKGLKFKEGRERDREIIGEYADEFGITPAELDYILSQRNPGFLESEEMQLTREQMRGVVYGLVQQARKIERERQLRKK